MIKFTKPENLDGFYLRQELTKSGIKLFSKSFRLVGDDLFLDIAAKDESAAQSVIEAHNGAIPYSAEIEAKAAAKAALLERLGITEDEAKLLLG
jgi:hypothetical protein